MSLADWDRPIMALWDFLKRKKEVEKSKQPEKKAEKVSVPKETKKTEAPKESAFTRTVPAKKFSYEVIKAPHISEKATNLAEKNKYIFTIYKNANKPEIKKAVEGIYGVNVLGVNVIKIPHKKRRLGRQEGFKKAYQKAVVTIKEGQKIEIF